jgi:shikimate 5-dehydrogenase
VDVLAQQGDDWHGFYLSDRAAAAALEATIRARTGAEKPLQGRSVMLVGIDEMTRAVGHRLAKSGAMLIVTSRNRDAAHRLAQELQCRYVMFEAVYSTLHDVLVHCNEETFATRSPKESELDLRYLKPGMTVMDLTAARRTPLLREAERRGCAVVPPKLVVLEQALQYAKLFSGKEPARQPLQELLDGLAPDDD